MLRDIEYGINKPVMTNYKAKKAMKTGVAVVIDEATGTFSFPTTATSDNVYFVDKERIATGVKSAYKNLSDYDEEFTTVKADDFAKLKAYSWGDVFATDAEGTPTKGKTVAFDGTGKIVDATVASPYKYIGDVVDNGHTLKQIRVLQTAVKNA